MVAMIKTRWHVKAYGLDFHADGPREAMDLAEGYGERHQLRAVSLIATRHNIPVDSIRNPHALVGIERISDTCAHAY